MTLACGKATPCFVFPEGDIGVVRVELAGKRASLALSGFVVVVVVVVAVAVQGVMAYGDDPCKIACRSATVRVSPG
jgi:hypothetical protein